MIVAKDVCFSAGGRFVLEQVSFAVAPGNMLAILGSNGAGKSTLLKLLSNEMQPTKGSITLGGVDLKKLTIDSLSSMRAVLSQKSTLSMPYTVAEVVALGRYAMKNKSPRENQSVIDAVLATTDLLHLAERNYLQLSGGEQQRTQLARVLAQIYDAEGVKYLFMDEPINSMDVKHQHNTLQIARRFADEGNCVITVLHDVNMALQYADDILMLKQGKQLACGMCADVCSEKMLEQTYGYPLRLISHSAYERPIVMPVV